MIQYFLILTLPSVIKYLYDYLHTNNLGPIPLPVLGNILLLLKNYENRLDYFTDLVTKYGNSCRIYLPHIFGFKRWIFINNCKSIKYVLKDNFNNYPKGQEFHDIFEELLGNGIFNSDGCVWASQRKISSYKFNVRSLRDYMTEIFCRQSDEIIKKIEIEHFPKNKANVFNIKKYFYDYTLNSIFEIGFGLQIDDIVNYNIFADSFDLVQPLFEYRFINPFWKLQRIMCIGYEYSIKVYTKIINNLVYDLIQNKKEIGNDILSQFKKNNISDQKLRDIMINFLIAGRDTTACLLTRACYLLLQNKEWKDKILEEFNSYNKYDYETMTKLKYMKAFLYECIRLYPPVPKNSKIALNNDILPCGTEILKGDRIIFSPYSVGRDPQYWQDTLKFNPDRWLNEESSNLNSYKFLGFNAGYRTCLGKNMAILEASIMLIKLLKNTKIELIDNYIKEKHGLLLDMQYLYVEFK